MFVRSLQYTITMADERTPKQILVIDGGGMRGLASLLIIDAIMKELPTKKGGASLPCQVFDLICGTSVGGLVSILLGRLGLDCQTAINVYEMAVKELFGEKEDAWKIIADGDSLDTSKFDAVVARVVAEYTGSPRVSMKLSLEDNQDPRSHPSTKMFVTMMENAPSYTHTISSYKRQLSASANRYWTVPEIARTTIASPIYISPQTFQTDKLRRFQDAGFGGYNNPILMASSEWKKIWPEERIGLVLSFGTGLRDYLPKALPTTREWHPSPQYARKFCDQVFRQLDVRKQDDTELNVTYAVRQLARIAADSSLSHQQFEMSRTSFRGQYYRIDEPFGLAWFDLVDVFQADVVKANVNIWLNTNVELIRGIAASLGAKSPRPVIQEILKSVPARVEPPLVIPKIEEPAPPPREPTPPPPTPPATMEKAQVMKPPPPPAETVQGYNPAMDEPRPTMIEDYLKNYDVLFIIDDSGSMLGSRWDETRDALLEIAEYASKLNVRSVSLRFLNRDISDQGIQGAEEIRSRFDGIIPSGWTPTGAILKEVLNSHLDRIDHAVSNSEEYSKIPPLDIIVLTDGVPTDDPAGSIEQAVTRLKSSRYHPNTMGIQFVQIGDEPDAKEALTALVKGDNGSIVDTVPYRGILTSAELRRIVLGGLHPNVRALVPESWLAQDTYAATL